MQSIVRTLVLEENSRVRRTLVIDRDRMPGHSVKATIPLLAAFSRHLCSLLYIPLFARDLGTERTLCNTVLYRSGKR